MKKLLFLLVAMMCFSAASAQKGEMAAGVNFNFGLGYSGSYSNIGVGVKYQYSFTDHIRIEPAFTYYFKKDLISMWDLMANVHYVFRVANDKLNVYPLVGLGVLGAKAGAFGYSASTTNFGVNLGGGVEYNLAEHWAIGAEIKYRIISNSWSHLGLQIGATYRF